MNVLDVSLYERRRAQRMEDPKFRDTYERSAREIEQTDQVIRALDELRVDLGIPRPSLRGASTATRRASAGCSRLVAHVRSFRSSQQSPTRSAPRFASCRRRRHRNHRRAGNASLLPRRSSVVASTFAADGQTAHAQQQMEASLAKRVDRSPTWAVVYYKALDGSAPALDFLDGCPGKIDAEFTAVLDAVAAAPPPQFSGGGKWEAMHGSMGGWHEIRLTEIRLTGSSREQFRLFCLLENAGDEELLGRGLSKPAIPVIRGMRKPWRTKFSEADYRRVRNLGDRHKASYPRRIAQ